MSNVPPALPSSTPTTIAQALSLPPRVRNILGIFFGRVSLDLSERIGQMLVESEQQLFKLAGQRIVALANRYYQQDDESALPRNIATKAAFENAMALDIAMGGSTNTVLHLLAAAQEAGVDFTMADIDRMSRKVPQLCKVAPSTQKYHMEDVHRAGGVVAILGQLEKAGLVHGDTRTVLGGSLAELLNEYDVSRQPSQEVVDFYRAGPAGIRTTKAFSQDCRWKRGCCGSVRGSRSSGRADWMVKRYWGDCGQDFLSEGSRGEEGRVDLFISLRQACLPLTKRS